MLSLSQGSWWRLGIGTACLGLLVPCILGAQGGPPTGPAERVLIRVRTSAQPALMAPGALLITPEDAQRISHRLERDYGTRSHGRALRFGLLFATVDSARLAALVADSMVVSVEPDVLTYLSDHDAAAPRTAPAAAALAVARSDAIPWGVERVGAPAAWAAGFTGAGVKVGIVDSGIDPSHPDLHVAGGYDFTSGSNSPSAWNDNVAACGGHGTHVAGTMAALQNGTGIVGVAPGVELYALKVFEIINGNCASWSSNQIAAIDWAVGHGIRVVNMSIASGVALQAYQDAITNASNAGVLVVAAAGNNSGGPITYPAVYDHAVAVGALTSSNAVAYFSDIGPQMWLAAPGMSIVSTVPGGGTATMDGTSMAAPHVAGVAALLIQQHPTWSATQVRDALRDGAQDISSPGWDSATGWGLVQAPGSAVSESLVLTVSPTSRHASVVQGGFAPSGQAAVGLAGTDAASATWTASRRKSWTTLTTGAGTGSGTVAWTRNATGLAVGMHVDTITVSASGASGSPAMLIDTLEVTAPAVPATMALSPASRRTSVVEEGAAPPDSATVTMSGTNSWSVGWNASARHPWTRVTTTSGAGSGKVRWDRDAGGLPAGTYVDTIMVTASAAGSPARIIDTLVVSPAPTALTLSVQPGSRRASVVQGGGAPGDQAFVSLTGAGATGTTWTATHSRSWLTLLTGSGTGSGAVRWSRNPTGLVPGVYVDTVRIASSGAAGSPATVIDSLVVTAPTIAVTLTLSPPSRSATGELYGSAPQDSATIVLTGADAATARWTAAHSAGWLALATTEGTGSGKLHWNRIIAGLAPGRFIDTITVTIPGAAGSPAFLIDTLTVTASTPLALAVSPTSRRANVVAGTGTVADQAEVMLTGAGATTTTWYAAASHGWITMQGASGMGPGTVRWQRQLGGLAPGTYVDTITVRAGALTARVIDSLVVSSDGKGGTIAIARHGSRQKQLRMGGQLTSIGSDSVLVQGVGAGAPIGNWTATTSSNWIHLESWSGGFPGMLRWSRSLGGLAGGMHVDSIVVRLVADPGFLAVFIDSVEVVNVTSPDPRQAASALFQGSGLTSDQLAILDAAGNKNGRYDLGDFLAWVDRGNIQLNAALMARVRQALQDQGETPDNDATAGSRVKPDP